MRNSKKLSMKGFLKELNEKNYHNKGDTFFGTPCAMKLINFHWLISWWYTSITMMKFFIVINYCHCDEFSYLRWVLSQWSIFIRVMIFHHIFIIDALLLQWRIFIIMKNKLWLSWAKLSKTGTEQGYLVGCLIY